MNILDKGNIAVVDAKSLAVKKHIDLSSKGVMNGSGLSLDAKSHILFSYWRLPSPVVVIANAETGDIITTFPTALNVDTVAFNPATKEAISTAGEGTMIFIKENSPASFEVERKGSQRCRARGRWCSTATPITWSPWHSSTRH